VSSTGSTKIEPTQPPGKVLLPADNSIQQNVSYLPRGAFYLIAAPFPWDDLTLARIALLPELVCWYLTVILGLLGLVWCWRRRRLEVLYVLAVGLTIAGVLSLAEGNLGTLVRHRAMLIPFALIFASFGALPLIPAIEGRLRAIFRASV